MNNGSKLGLLECGRFADFIAVDGSPLENIAILQNKERIRHVHIAGKRMQVPARSSDELYSAIEKAITPRTKVIAITHLTSTTGIQYPAREIAALKKFHEAQAVVDRLTGRWTMSGAVGEF